MTETTEITETTDSAKDKPPAGNKGLEESGVDEQICTFVPRN